MKRKNDTQHKAHFRTSRMFKEGDSWYFDTRGGELLGPFEDELEASSRLEAYIRMADAGLLPSSSLALVLDTMAAGNAP
jgi:hypothetical protein